jgi:myo-inositol 2-dehydrogenase / D-chiro-inositol 1-dehydrogenase
MPAPARSRATRREFLQRSTALATGAALVGTLSVARSAHAAGSDLIRVALVGCGGRGTGAASNVLSTKANCKLVAVADAFEDSVARAVKALTTRHKDRVDVPAERQFVGLDAYQKAIDCGADLVLLCSPPGFRPAHFEAAVKAGKHAFLEKPVATDAPGVRRILAANEEAKQKKLAVAVGHHLRHEVKHKEVVNRIHDGLIGDVSFVRAYFNSGGVWVRARQAGQTEMQYQVRNWYYFTWLSGDHIVEQHVHDLDVGNWIKGARPVRANGMGGRQVRIGKDYGEIYDHHAVEFEYADGSRMFSYCRHIPACWGSFSQHAHGTKGRASIEGHGSSLIQANGQEPQTWKRTADGHQVEMDDLLAALTAGQPYNEVQFGAESTMTAILGRMATYSGQLVEWDAALASKVDLAPERITWDATPKSQPGADGIYPCSIPGVSRPF